MLASPALPWKIATGLSSSVAVVLTFVLLRHPASPPTSTAAAAKSALSAPRRGAAPKSVKDAIARLAEAGGPTAQCEALGDLGDDPSPEAAHATVEFFKVAHATPVRACALDALEKQRGEEVDKALAEAAFDRNFTVRERAAEAAMHSAEAIAAVKATASAPNTSAPVEALRALCNHGESVRAVIEARLDSLSIRDQCVLVEALPDCADEGTAPLLQRIATSANESLRSSAISALGRLGGDDAVEGFVAALGGPDSRAAGAALLESAAGRAALVRIASMDDSRASREAFEILANSQAEEAIPLMKASLSDRTRRRVATLFLGENEVESAVPLLGQLVSVDSIEFNDPAVADALQNIGTEDALSLLEGWATDRRLGDFSETALNALSRAPGGTLRVRALLAKTVNDPREPLSAQHLSALNDDPSPEGTKAMLALEGRTDPSYFYPMLAQRRDSGSRAALLKAAAAGNVHAIEALAGNDGAISDPKELAVLERLTREGTPEARAAAMEMRLSSDGADAYALSAAHDESFRTAFSSARPKLRPETLAALARGTDETVAFAATSLLQQSAPKEALKVAEEMAARGNLSAAVESTNLLALAPRKSLVEKALRSADAFEPAVRSLSTNDPEARALLRAAFGENGAPRARKLAIAQQLSQVWGPEGDAARAYIKSAETPEEPHDDEATKEAEESAGKETEESAQTAQETTQFGGQPGPPACCPCTAPATEPQ